MSLEETSENKYWEDHSGTDDWALLTKFSHYYRSLLEVMMDRVGLHRAQVNVLCRLFEQDGLTQTEIADRLSVQGATITNMLQRMEETGLVTRHRDPEDNRLVRVYLTEKGSQKEQVITDLAQQVETSVFEGLNTEERTALRRIMEVMLKNIETVG